MVIALDPSSGVPLYLQLQAGLRQRLAAGDPPAGTPLPGSRELAVELRVNYHTVARAYRELELEGLVERQRGGAFVVARRATQRAADQVMGEAVSTLCQRARELGLSRDDVVELVAQEWRLDTRRAG